MKSYFNHFLLLICVIMIIAISACRKNQGDIRSMLTGTYAAIDSNWAVAPHPYAYLSPDTYIIVKSLTDPRGIIFYDINDTLSPFLQVSLYSENYSSAIFVDTPVFNWCYSADTAAFYNQGQGLYFFSGCLSLGGINAHGHKIY